MATDARRSFDIDARDIERRLALVDFQEEDRRRVVALAPVVSPAAEALADEFFAYLARLPEADPLMRSWPARDEARALKVAHLRAMTNGTYGPDYVSQRLRLAELYAATGLEPRVFLGAFHALMRAIGDRVMRSGGDPIESFARFMSLKKIAFFDVSLIVDVVIAGRERVIQQQAATLRELSTPVLIVRDRLIVAPLIGAIDEQRAQHLAATLLRRARETRALAAIIDVTGVPTIDSMVANQLLRIAKALRLLGVAVLLTGVSTDVATALVRIGFVADDVRTLNDLQDGVEAAERLLRAATPPA